MTFCSVPASLLYQLEQELDTDEKETMVFLCSDLMPDVPVPDTLRLLTALNEKEMLTTINLSELLYRLKRFDLLKKFLGTGRAAVEANLANHSQMLSKYRVLMTEINEDLDKEDLRSLSFLLKSHLGTSHKEKSFLAIITDLEKLDLISPMHLDLIENCFLTIHRKDLAKKIQKYKLEAHFPTMNANTLQMSLPKLSLADPPEPVNKERVINGACAVQAEQIHISIPETEVQGCNKYRMQSKPLGVCLIIDCIGNDAGLLTKTFKSLHFEVHCRLFLNMDAVMRDLYEAARLRAHKDADCFVCVLISRGNHQHIFCTDHVVPGFQLERLKDFFTGEKCPDLLGKPKLFFIQNYVEPQNWQGNASLTEADGDLCTIPQVADIFWSHCTLDASVLERSPCSSSYYLSTLAGLLMDPQKRKLPLLDIFVELNNRVYEWNRINSTEQYLLLLKHTLRKKLFLIDKLQRKLFFMADNDNVAFHQQLLSIDENLGKDDVEDLKFLCSDFITLKKLETVKSAQDIFLFLINEDLINKDDYFLIAELLYIIGCNFLLPKLGYTKQIVQEELCKRRKVSGYRQLLYEITQDLTMDNVKNAAFLLKAHLPKKQPIMSALELLTSLEKKDLLMESDLSNLEYICKKTAPHLLKKVEMYKQAKVPHQGIKETVPSSICAFNKPTFGSTSLEELVLPKNHEHLYDEQFGSLQELTGNVCSLAANLDVKAEPVFDSLRQGLQQTVRENDTNAEAVMLSQYKMDGQCRGYCLIINNVNFEGDLKKRNGSEKDAMELKRVFTWLGFKVKKYDDKTSTEIEALLEFWQSSKDWKDSDCLVCCILSHGKSGKIFGTDECLIPIRTITSYFKANRCPLLAQKPKLFFIQACQGEKTQQPVFLQEDTGHAASLEPDAQSSGFVSSQQLTSSIPDEADFLLGMATVDGYLSFRHVQEGTWYIQALCSKLQLLVPRGEDLLSILTEVNEEVSKRADAQRERKQMPQPAYTLRKKLIFPVPNKPFVASEQSSDRQ
ncbi:uncharacterized protein LOC131199572 [Ahaetulla prasina]|uniref:uncharacterized protein LOC131199572 n=1 Tax=Ahaetulla prasina TaxID=499056 RepID=UPI0026477EBE|nr:uncharacterized protein LOC131199572 [Ahaetulla prasina]